MSAKSRSTRNTESVIRDEQAEEKEVPEVQEPTPVVPDMAQLQDTQWVKHRPHEFFGARVITEAQWASIGVRQQTVEWNQGNGFQLPKSMFSEEALNYLLNVDDGFQIVGK